MTAWDLNPDAHSCNLSTPPLSYSAMPDRCMCYSHSAIMQNVHNLQCILRICIRQVEVDMGAGMAQLVEGLDSQSIEVPLPTNGKLGSRSLHHC